MGKIVARGVWMSLCLGLMLAPSALSQTGNRASEQTVKELERNLTDAENAGNVEKVSQILADGYIALDDNGTKITKNQLLDFLKSGTMKTDSEQLGPMDVTVFGNVAVVMGSDTEKASTKVQDSDGKWGWVDASGKYVWMDVWARQGDGSWQVVRTQVHQLAASVNQPSAASAQHEKSGESKGEVASTAPTKPDKIYAVPKPVIAQANPKSRTYDVSAERLFSAATRAAAPHKVTVEQDEGVKQLNEAGQEIKTLWFLTTISGYPESVDAIIHVAPVDTSSAKLTVFYHKHGGTNLDTPSGAFEVRKAQLQAELQTALDAIEAQQTLVDWSYQTGEINSAQNMQKSLDLIDKKTQARLTEARQEFEARQADMAQMPTSTFQAMDEAADKYFNLVLQKLQPEDDKLKTRTTSPKK